MDTPTPEPHAINIIDLTNSPGKNAGDLNTELESCKKESSLGLYVFCYLRPVSVFSILRQLHFLGSRTQLCDISAFQRLSKQHEWEEAAEMPVLEFT